MVNPPTHPPHETYYRSEEDLLLSEVVDSLIVRYGESYELIKELIKDLLTKELLTEFDKFIEIQSRPGTYDYDAYQYGMANGMLFLRSLLTNEEPEYLERPDRWLEDMRNEERGFMAVVGKVLTNPTRFARVLRRASCRF